MGGKRTLSDPLKTKTFSPNRDWSAKLISEGGVGLGRWPKSKMRHQSLLELTGELRSAESSLRPNDGRYRSANVRQFELNGVASAHSGRRAGINHAAIYREVV
jgi:hypothetical protein